MCVWEKDSFCCKGIFVCWGKLCKGISSFSRFSLAFSFVFFLSSFGFQACHMSYVPFEFSLILLVVVVVILLALFLSLSLCLKFLNFPYQNFSFLLYFCSYTSFLSFCQQRHTFKKCTHTYPCKFSLVLLSVLL